MSYQAVFPAALQPTASALLSALADGELSPAGQGFKVLVRGEVISAPCRIYCKTQRLRSVIAKSAGDTRTLALSLGTRHCDGYLREECLQQLLAADRPWVVPFIVQLLGEYVIEIVELIAAAIPNLDASLYAEFVQENPGFMALTRCRATSYWACYYRSQFPALKGYPAIAALDAIEQMGLRRGGSLG